MLTATEELMQAKSFWIGVNRETKNFSTWISPVASQVEINNGQPTYNGKVKQSQRRIKFPTTVKVSKNKHLIESLGYSVNTVEQKRT